MAQTVILVVEDERSIAENIGQYLESTGYKVEKAYDGLEALEKNKHIKPDLILLDLMLPQLNGLEVLKKIRKEYYTPVILVTAKGEEIDKLIGLELGADDYITKPFSLREIEARIKAVLRRTKGQELVEKEDVLRFNDLEINIHKYQVFLKSEIIELTPTEFSILLTLARSPGRPFSRLQLLNNVLGESYAGYERAIDTHVSNLRKKIEENPHEPQFILTVYGIGYKFGVQK